MSEDSFNFSIEKKGYNMRQVDGAIDELRAKNEYLNVRVNELERKLDMARRLVKQFSERENGLRRDIAASKRAAAEMMADTKERSDTLLDKTRESCGEIISDLDMKIADRMNTLDVMRAEIAAFKDNIFTMYSKHIDLIESVADTVENFVYEPDYSEISNAIDEFEEKKDTTEETPEFEEYPQESIFKEYFESEEKKFVLEEKEPEQAVKDAEYTAESIDSAEEKTVEFVSESMTETNEEKDSEEAEAEFVIGESEPEIEVEAEDESADEYEIPENDEYYKFLTDFINEDEESDGDLL